jgi:hypothetical protein
MKRMTPYFIAITILALGSLTNAWADCSRDKLDDTVDKYFESLMTHSTSILPLAPDAKFTENGVKKDVGEGFWKTAGKPLLKRILIDTKKCSAAVIAVVEEKFDSKTVGQGGMGGFGGMMGQPKEMPAEGTIRPILFAARLKVEKDKVTEIETIVARENEFMFNPDNVLATKDQDWETILPPEKRTPRKVLADAANHYFDLFRNDSTVSVPFAEVCDRWENGFQTTAADHDCSPVTFRKQTGTSLNHGPRRVWVDTEKGISIAFMAFGGGASASEENPTGGGLVDCHMFRMRDGKVDLIHSIVGPRAQSMGWPLEPIE